MDFFLLESAAGGATTLHCHAVQWEGRALGGRSEGLPQAGDRVHQWLPGPESLER